MHTELVSLDPTISIDPLAQQFTIGANTDGQPIPHAAFTAARSAMGSVFDIAGKLATADQAIRDLGAQPDPATDARLRRGARQQMAEAKKALDGAFAALGDQAVTLAAQAEELTGAPLYRTGVTENARGAEVRQWLRGMAPAQRTDALNEALAAKDREIVASVLAASPILSGLNRDHFANFTTDARRTFAPDQNRLLGGIERLTQALRTAEDTLTKRFAKITGEGSSRHAAAERALSALEGSAA